MLALEDGVVYEGRSFGHAGETTGEVVFNTALSGYQEVLTDPSYAGQIVTMTYPHIGNYGVNVDDVESADTQVAGFVVREASTTASSWRSSGELHEYLDDHGVVGITEVDTRALTRHLRDHGAKRGVISALVTDPAALVAKARASRSMIGLDLAREVTCAEAYHVDAPAKGTFKVVAYDFGMKTNIGRMLAAAGCDVTVVPATTSAEDTLALKPDGVFLSNGPGDPEPCTYAIEASRKLMQKEVPIFGICLGHQILGLACGAQHLQAEVRPSRREPPGEEPRHRPRRGHLAEPRVLGGRGGLRPAGADPHPPEPQRRDGGGLPPPRPARGLRAVPSRGEPGPP